MTLKAMNGSGTGTGTLTLTIGAGTSSGISFVQGTAGAASGTASTFSLAFPANTLAGDLIVVGFDFQANAFSSITDSQGNTFTQVGSQLTSPGGSNSRLYYTNTAAGGADTITINFSAKSNWIEIYLSEYSGVNQTTPIDVQAGASGSSGSVSSGTATTTTAGDLIYGYCAADSTCTLGSGFTARSTLNSNLLEDMTAGSAGSYAATGTANGGWTMHMVALKPSSSGGSAPTITSATSANGTVGTAFSYQITAS